MVSNNSATKGRTLSVSLLMSLLVLVIATVSVTAQISNVDLWGRYRVSLIRLLQHQFCQVFKNEDFAPLYRFYHHTGGMLLSFVMCHRLVGQY